MSGGLDQGMRNQHSWCLQGLLAKESDWGGPPSQSVLSWTSYVFPQSFCLSAMRNQIQDGGKGIYKLQAAFLTSLLKSVGKILNLVFKKIVWYQRMGLSECSLLRELLWLCTVTAFLLLAALAPRPLYLLFWESAHYWLQLKIFTYAQNIFWASTMLAW